MALKKSPCYGCEDRTSECHAKCPRYAEFAKNRNDTLLLQWKVKKTRRALDDVKAGCIKSCTHGKIKRSAR